jgi:2-phospho-L-lactate transferase/gluconeogenesis factor (CofD/UPF0052 family)
VGPTVLANKLLYVLDSSGEWVFMSLEVDQIHTPTSAKVVIGDLDVSAAEEVITEIVKAGG